MLATRRRHKDPCFANGRPVISSFSRGNERPPVPQPEGDPSMRLLTARLALLAPILASLALPAFAAATASPTEISTALGKGVTYLKGLQAESGEIPGFGGDWSLTSLAAAGTAPADVNKAGKTGKDARSWYGGGTGAAPWPGEAAVATDFERGALLDYAAGVDPARVSKRQNLLAKVA